MHWVFEKCDVGQSGAMKEANGQSGPVRKQQRKSRATRGLFAPMAKKLTLAFRSCHFGVFHVHMLVLVDRGRRLRNIQAAGKTDRCGAVQRYRRRHLAPGAKQFGVDCSSKCFGGRFSDPEQATRQQRGGRQEPAGQTDGAPTPLKQAARCAQGVSAALSCFKVGFWAPRGGKRRRCCGKRAGKNAASDGHKRSRRTRPKPANAAPAYFRAVARKMTPQRAAGGSPRCSRAGPSKADAALPKGPRGAGTLPPRLCAWILTVHYLLNRVSWVATARSRACVG